MIREMTLPQLSMGMSEGTIVEWMRAEGANVERGQPLVSIETEKIVTELPAPYGGFVHLLAQAGDKLPVEARIAQFADTESEYRTLLAPSGASHPEAPAPADEVRRPAADGAAHGEEPLRPRLSGLAKALAREHGLDPAQLVGTGPGGRVTRDDVLVAVAGNRTGGSVPAASAHARRERSRFRLSGMRGTIAQRVLAAKIEAAQTYLFFEFDVTRLLAVRAGIQGYATERGNRVSLVTLYARALALACRDVPVCNATLADGEVTLWESVNVGVAVALPGRGVEPSGLVVPVLRDVQEKDLVQIDRDLKALVGRAKSGTLSAEDIADGTITLSSTEGFLPGGWMVSAPVLTLPQVVSFQPGTPIEKPVVVDGQVAVRTMLPCGVTYDHQAMDGEPIGRFVRKMRDLLIQPDLLL